MNDWHYFFDHVPHNLNEGTYRIFEPQWKAEILHWFEREDVGKEQKEEFIQALIDFDDGCGDFYRYRAYFLAGEALSYFQECSLGDRIVRQLLKWSYAYFREKPDWKTFPRPLGEKARSTLKVTDKERVIPAFEQLLHTTQSRHTLRHAAVRLVQLDPGNETALAALVLLVQQKDLDTLQRIVWDLQEIDSGNKIQLEKLLNEVIAALVYLMETTPHKPICRNAIYDLAKIGYGNQVAIATLVSFVQTNRGDEICFVAAQTLWQIDPANATAIDSLVYILETTQNRYLFSTTAATLVEFTPGNKAAIAALSERLETTEDEFFRCEAAASLLKFDLSNETAIATLVQHLDKTPSNKIYWNAFYALSKICFDNGMAKTLLKEIIAALVRFLQMNGGDNFCFNAALYLWQIEPGNEMAIAALVQMLEINCYDWMRLHAAELLAQTEDYRQKAIDTLFELIHLQDEYVLPHLPAISALAKIDPSHQLALNALAQLVDTAQDEATMRFAAKSLEQLDPGNEMAKASFNKVIATLIRFVQTFQEFDDDENCNPIKGLFYESCLLDITERLRKVLPNDRLPQAVIALKTYLSEEVYKQSSYRYEAVFNVIWHCAQNMTYPDFYKVWHN